MTVSPLLWSVEEGQFRIPTVQIKVVPETLPLPFIHAAISVAVVAREKVVLYIAHNAGKRRDIALS